MSGRGMDSCCYLLLEEPMLLMLRSLCGAQIGVRPQIMYILCDGHVTDSCAAKPLVENYSVRLTRFIFIVLFLLQ